MLSAKCCSFRLSLSVLRLTLFPLSSFQKLIPTPARWLIKDVVLIKLCFIKSLPCAWCNNSNKLCSWINSLAIALEKREEEGHGWLNINQVLMKNSALFHNDSTNFPMKSYKVVVIEFQMEVSFIFKFSPSINSTVVNAYAKVWQSNRDFLVITFFHF